MATNGRAHGRDRSGREPRNHVATARSQRRPPPASKVRREIAAAVGLLTRIPVTVAADRGGAAAFGLVGAVVGLTAAPPLIWLGSIAPLAAAALALALLAIVSGAIHLDGLADTADALAAPTSDAAERARHDPRAGAAGVVALVAILVIDAALLAALIERSGPLAAAAAAIGAAATSRSAAAFAPTVARGRLRAGFGQWFATKTTLLDSAIAAVTALAVSAGLGSALGRDGLAAATVAGLAFGVGAAVVVARLRDGLDGDGLGAIVELTFAATLLAALVLA